ncbi:uncharacterized protein BDR25DRAFT_243083, partial [Lindgomyces ingoldianus]
GLSLDRVVLYISRSCNYTLGLMYVVVLQVKSFKGLMFNKLFFFSCLKNSYFTIISKQNANIS